MGIKKFRNIREIITVKVSLCHWIYDPFNTDPHQPMGQH